MSREMKVTVAGAALVSTVVVVVYVLRHRFAEAWAAGDFDSANRAAHASFLIRDWMVPALAVLAILAPFLLATRSGEDTAPALGADPWLGYL